MSAWARWGRACLPAAAVSQADAVLAGAVITVIGGVGATGLAIIAASLAKGAATYHLQRDTLAAKRRTAVNAGGQANLAAIIGISGQAELQPPADFHRAIAEGRKGTIGAAIRVDASRLAFQPARHANPQGTANAFVTCSFRPCAGTAEATSGDRLLGLCAHAPERDQKYEESNAA